MTDRRFGARPLLSVDGSPLAENVQDHVRQVVVETDVRGPDSCRLVLDDPRRELLGATGLDLAAALTVSAGRTGEESGVPLFEGVVYRLGFDYDDRGGFTTVVAYDRSYGLYHGVHTATYLDVTDSDLATTLARLVGLTPGRIDPTPVVHEHLSQVNETHWQFLRRRAREIDHTLRVTGNTLDFVRSTDAGEGPEPGDYESVDRLQLVPGGNLERLSVSVTAAGQVSEVEVRGWDPRQKRTVVATAPARTRAAALRDAPAAVADRFGAPRHVTVDLPLVTQSECDAVAAARAERIAGACVYAEGVAHGDPRIVAGAAASLGQTGGRFDGKVTVSRARHTWDRRGYRTFFTVSGGHDRSVFGLVEGAGPDTGGSARGTGAGPGAGLVTGIVTNVTDPERRGRVKLRFPWLSDDYESDWARVVQLGAGPDRGLLLLPEVDDEVLVGFEHGDSRRPYVLGGVFNGVDTPPHEGGVDPGPGTVAVRALRSRAGHEIVLDDTEGAERVAVRTRDGAVTLVLDAVDGSVRIEATGDVSVAARGDAAVTADRDLTVEAGGSARITAKTGLTLESRGEVVVKGATIRLN